MDEFHSSVYHRSYLTISGSICLLISTTAHYLSVQNAVNTSINRKMGMLHFLYKSMFSSLTHLLTDIYCVNSLCRRLAFQGGGSVVVDLLFNVPPIVCSGYLLVFFWYALLYVNSSFAIILMRKRELIALLDLSS